LTGPGGVGKTRLAIRATEEARKEFRDGIFWVGLVGISDPNLVSQEIAHALRIHEVPSEPILETAKGHLRSKEALLVLDNCEHLIRTCPVHVEQLLAACPELKVLTTSIEALGLFNEITWQVPSLPLPDGRAATSVADIQQFASIELFRARADNAKAGFQLDEYSASAVAQICRRLDGIPLAIELAAARIKMLSVDEIAARLDDRFSLLTSGSRTAIPRHQTLRATIDWSHELLSEPERVLFRRLAAFAGSFTLESAEAVCSAAGLRSADLLDTVGRLVDKSLLLVESEPVAGETRYRLLETIRQYALEKLLDASEAHAIREQHAQFYLKLAEQSEPKIYGDQTAVWFARLDKDLDNIRSAIEWTTTIGEAQLALRILGALVYFWFARGLVGSEWNDKVQAAFACADGQKRTLARAKALNGIGFMYWMDIYPTGKRAELEEALSIAVEFGDHWNMAMALRNLGLYENIQGNYAEARAFLEQSLEIWSQMGPLQRLGRANALMFLGDVALNQGDHESARSLFEECMATFSEANDLNFLAYVSRRLAHLAWLNGDVKTALARCKDSLNLNLKAGDPRGVIASIAGIAAIELVRSEFERAGTLLAAVDSQLAAIRVKLLYLDRIEYERNLAVLRRHLSDAVLDECWAEGRALSMDQAIELALESR
jgi:predicted ATPase